MIRVVIESAFGRNVDGSRCTSAEYARNARYLDRCIRDSLERGEAPYASHGFFPAPGRLDDTDLTQRAQGIATGQEWARVAALIAVYNDHGITEGMQSSLNLHEARGIPIEFRSIGAEPTCDTEPVDDATEYARKLGAGVMTQDEVRAAMSSPLVPYIDEPPDV